MKTKKEIKEELEILDLVSEDNRFKEGVEYALLWVLGDYHISPSDSFR